MTGVIAMVVLGCAKSDDRPIVPTGTAGGSAGASTPGTAGGAGTLAGTAGNTGGGGGSGAGAGAGGMAGATTCTMPPTAHIAWTVGRDANGAEVPCDQAGAGTVQLLMNSIRSEFQCAAKSGTTMGLVPGTFVPRVLLIDSKGMVLSQGNLPAVTIPSCGVTNLVGVRFLVTPSTTGTGGAGGGAGGGGGGGSSGTAGTGGGTGPCDATPIFAVHSCAVDMACHDAKGSAAGFDMKTVGWEKKLVGVSPKAGGAQGIGSVCTNVGMPYLVAGSAPARGLFLSKLQQPKPPCGSQMPLLPPDLTPQELDCVQRWANGIVSGK
jgi:hypothetical protein